VPRSFLLNGDRVQGLRALRPGVAFEYWSLS
jgi:hypothetical protein